MATTNHWELDLKNMDSFLQRLGKISLGTEQVMQETLDKTGVPLAESSIQPTIPISKWKGKTLHKKHAHDYKALSTEKGHLSFTTRPKPRFNYLKYPDLGIGTSQYNVPKFFMKKGLDKSAPKIIRALQENVINDINKNLGGI